MKKLILPILLAAATFVGCTQSDMTEIAPEIQMGTTDLGVGTNQGGDDESRASYDDNLRFYWEESDEIAILQDCTGGYQQTLTLFDGADKGNGFFRNASYEYVMNKQANFHFVYPASSADLSGKRISLPAQDGVWTPILVASTNKTVVDNLYSVNMTSIAGALAVRVFSNDKKTPYRVKTITVSGTKPFLGEFVGVLDADGKMTYTPSATGKTFTANVENIPLNSTNNYEYRFEVLPVEAGIVTVTLTDIDGNVITLSTSSEKTFKVNTRTGVNVAWDPTVSIDEVTSWYEEAVANGSSSLAPNTIYIKGVKSNGGIGAPKILVDGSVYPHTTLSDGTYVLSNVPSGEHIVRAVVGQPDGSSEISDGQTVQVTKIPTVSYTARSTYAYNNGTKVRENNESNRTSILFEGLTISGSDDYTTSKLNLSNVAFVYGSSSATVSSSASSASPTRIDNVAVGAHSCYVKVALSANAKVTISSPASTIYVTGLPLSVSGGKDNYTNNGWSISSCRESVGYFAIYTNQTITSPQLYMPNDSFTTYLDGSRSSGTGGSISVGPVNGSKVSMAIDKNNNYTATVTLNGLDNIRYTISLSGSLVDLRYVMVSGVEFKY